MATSEVFTLDIYCGTTDVCVCPKLVYHEESNSEEELHEILDKYLENRNFLDKLKYTFGSTYLQCEIGRKCETNVKMVIPLW